MSTAMSRPSDAAEARSDSVAFVSSSAQGATSPRSSARLLLLLGFVAGLYIAAVSMTILLAFTISGAWLLLVGAHQEDVPPQCG